VKQTLARNCRIAAMSASGGACSSRIAAAPMRSGKSKRPPRPKVNAIGGEPMKRSSIDARNTYRP
jgi:hypothetical protein